MRKTKLDTIVLSLKRINNSIRPTWRECSIRIILDCVHFRFVRPLKYDTEHSCIYNMEMWWAVLANLVKLTRERTFAQKHMGNCVFFLKLDPLFPFPKEDGPSLILFKVVLGGLSIGAQLENKQTNSTFILLLRKKLKLVWIIFGGWFSRFSEHRDHWGSLWKRQIPQDLALLILNLSWEGRLGKQSHGKFIFLNKQPV